MSEKSNVVTIFNPDGTESDYELMSSRIPKFLSKFGPDNGYRVGVQAIELLSLCPVLADLYKAAIENGKTPAEAGLPDLAGSFVFRAALFNQEGNEVNNDFSLQALHEFKDFECGVTGARQRLMAAMGFGGKVFDTDEQSAIAELGGTLQQEQKPQVGQKPGKRSGKVKAVPADNQADAGDAAQPDSSGEQQEPVAEEPQQEAQAPAQDVPVVEGVPEGLVRQIEHQARMQGVKVPKYTNQEEAKKVLKQLLQPK